MKYYRWFLVLLVTLIVLVYAYPRVAAHADTLEISTSDWVVSPAPVSIPPILQKIAHCESKKGQFNANGTVVTHQNVNSTYDIGAFQINSIHIQEAAKLGWDLETLRGNQSYALYLYQREGAAPWYSSIGCWG